MAPDQLNSTKEAAKARPQSQQKTAPNVESVQSRDGGLSVTTSVVADGDVESPGLQNRRPLKKKELTEEQLDAEVKVLQSLV